ncbi:3-dehydroquinate synthase [Prosthecobacter dejongeii]|uniref:3-dehydroquinate synthase n=2 Tax=Prosthecobacter dejongeii TaxID=48465 RepID=A0A7W8DQU1_9BACT|nr:3-dehydroquinate synthase [Prosthecobacter dejongeii]
MLEKKIRLEYAHRILFTRDVFAAANTTICDLLLLDHPNKVPRVLVFVDDHVASANPQLLDNIRSYARAHAEVLDLAGEPVILPGGEPCKNDFSLVQQCWQAINDAGLDRHSYVFVIGGGATLDLVCFAAATAHRGIRHVRFPTTTLSQGDGGVGVKNGVNYFEKKNWVGSFAVPFAVVNDFAFLESLPERERRNGIIEAIKVSLIRDRAFFEEIEQMAPALARLEQPALERVVQRSAELHVEHIATGGDPFELGSARPLDFGHWAAHKLEQITHFAVTHGEAVAIGMAVDLLYSVKKGILDAPTAQRVMRLVEQIGFEIYHPSLLAEGRTGEPTILEGLEEFREHLGGELTVTLVPKVGQKLEVHEMDRELILEAVEELRVHAEANHLAPAGR